jgi:hypothetical protein
MLSKIAMSHTQMLLKLAIKKRGGRASTRPERFFRLVLKGLAFVFIRLPPRSTLQGHAKRPVYTANPFTQIALFHSQAIFHKQAYFTDKPNT